MAYIAYPAHLPALPCTCIGLVPGSKDAGHRCRALQLRRELQQALLQSWLQQFGQAVVQTAVTLPSSKIAGAFGRTLQCPHAFVSIALQLCSRDCLQRCSLLPPVERAPVKALPCHDGHSCRACVSLALQWNPDVTLCAVAVVFSTCDHREKLSTSMAQHPQCLAPCKQPSDTVPAICADEVLPPLLLVYLPSVQQHGGHSEQQAPSALLTACSVRPSSAEQQGATVTQVSPQGFALHACMHCALGMWCLLAGGWKPCLKGLQTAAIPVCMHCRVCCHRRQGHSPTAWGGQPPAAEHCQPRGRQQLLQPGSGCLHQV